MEVAIVEMIRKYIDANRLMSVIQLPETFKDRTLEVIVLSADEQRREKHPENTAEIIDSLVGAVPYTNLSLSELREERLTKYEITD